MKRLFVSVLTFAVLSSCVSYPPPRVENGSYTNFEYEFIVALPEGWTYSDKPPEFLARVLSREKLTDVKLSLINKETAGFIFVTGSKFYYKVDTPEKLEKIKSDLAATGEKQKQIADSDPDKNYAYGIYDIDTRFEPQLLFRGKLVTENDFLRWVVYSNSFLYFCEEKNTCGLDVILLSDDKTYFLNYTVYKKMMDSLSRLSP